MLQNNLLYTKLNHLNENNSETSKQSIHTRASTAYVVNRKENPVDNPRLSQQLHTVRAEVSRNLTDDEIIDDKGIDYL